MQNESVITENHDLSSRAVFVDESHGASSSNAGTRRVAFWLGLTILPASVGLLAKVAGANWKSSGIAGVASGLAFGIVRSQLARVFTEEAPYVLERKVGDLEIRRYPKKLCLETSVEASSLHASLSESFRLLAKYLSQAKAPMTTPVQIMRSDRQDSERMHMRSNTEYHRAGPGRFTMRFTMPTGTADSLPEPQDARVHLREIPSHRTATLRFSGRLTEAKIEAAERELHEAVKHALLSVVGEPVYSAFDAPMTLPFLRRNEISVKLADLS